MLYPYTVRAQRSRRLHFLPLLEAAFYRLPLMTHLTTASEDLRDTLRVAPQGTLW